MPRQRIAVGHGHHQRLAAQGQHLDADLAFRRRQAPQPHIDAAFGDLRPLRCRSAFEQLQLHLRMALAEQSDRLGEQVRQGDGAGVAEGQVAGQPLRQLAGEAGGALQLVQQAACVRQEQAALGGEGHRPAGAVEQAKAQLFLQRGYLPGQGRLRHVQALGGAAEMQGFGNGCEAAQAA